MCDGENPFCHYFLGDFDGGLPSYIRRNERVIPSHTSGHFHVIRKDDLSHEQLYNELKRRGCDRNQLLALELSGFLTLDVHPNHKTLFIEIQRYMNYGNKHSYAI